MNNRPELYEQLKKLISSSKNNELECRKYLDRIKKALFENPVIVKNQSIISEKEFRTYAGDSDFIVVGEIINEVGIEKKIMLVWELKAPQCPIFKIEKNKNRLIPSNALVSAENQLLNYYHEIKHNETRRAELGICRADDVKIGGIIISCDKNQVSGKYIDEVRKNHLFRTAQDIRQKYFYDHNHIRLLNWDYILDYFKPGDGNKKINGDLDEYEKPNTTYTLSASTSVDYASE